MHLTLLCDLSFAGKSTLAERLAIELDALLVSLDAINLERGLRGGQGIPIEEWARTNEIAHERASRRLTAGRRAVVDDTGSPRFIREVWRAVADDAGAGFSLVWVQIDTELQRERVLMNRDDPMRPDVIDRVLDKHREQFEQPTADEDAIVVDARHTANPEIVRPVADAILNA
ncbi:ATP-binding protein [Microbacterium sp. KUDC0406]|uniref:AAA family ATPase n=1 Tax=Microbacterium sp. KUDC0406 TaxID=2909588 RepID=UPI001F2D79F4|nr:ATP-binding protein [Microbacterium sp. KUDC0406]UJP09747.1 ATP-binding protein [Microbacterium sp. KUDC0406]